MIINEAAQIVENKIFETIPEIQDCIVEIDHNNLNPYFVKIWIEYYIDKKQLSTQFNVHEMSAKTPDQLIKLLQMFLKKHYAGKKICVT